ncbi:YheC/YheD family protein [Virgibacillus halodenitrificans]|uniref:YheC/YheD family protein n=1 Tax=Virgibacillus halodenitrificans TaxID=1482 RepID=UPI00037FF19D|nr:YheC/YheD family protein [Virgibacillus halodenitrificans]
MIGFMRNYLNPTYIAQVLSINCYYHGIEFIYFRPKDVDMNRGVVKGKVFKNYKWKTIETKIPTFIDVSPMCFKHKEVMEYLRKRAILSDSGENMVSKEKLQTLLEKDSNFSHLLIPTKAIESIKDITEFLNKYSQVVLKPVDSRRGKGVYIVSKKSEIYQVGYQEKDREMDVNQLEHFYENTIKNKGYILQKYISSRTIQGDPFDCRVHVEKNGQGEWEVARNFIRIGIGQKVISNINRGGGISDPKPFLKANFGDNWEKINNKLNELAVTFPYRMEEIREQELMVMGLDVAIDKDGSLFLFEVNFAPVVAPLKAEVGSLRSAYYKYILTNNQKESAKFQKKKLNKKHNSNNKSIEKERDVLKKEINKIKNSTSWRVTKPIRIIGKIVSRKK